MCWSTALNPGTQSCSPDFSDRPDRTMRRFRAWQLPAPPVNVERFLGLSIIRGFGVSDKIGRLTSAHGTACMDFISSAILSGAAYDIVKAGVLITADKVTEKLGRWITQDTVAAQVAAQLNQLGITDELSPIGIERRIDKSPELGQLIEQINAHVATVAPSTITTVNQHHNGSGDNVAGNKIQY